MSEALEALEAKRIRNFFLDLAHKQALRILEQEKQVEVGIDTSKEEERNGRHHLPPLVQRPSCRTTSFMPLDFAMRNWFPLSLLLVLLTVALRQAARVWWKATSP